MEAQFRHPDRNMVPRLRDVQTTARLGELDSATEAAPKRNQDLTLLEAKVRDWKENPTVSFAADLAGAALVLGHPEYAREAAEFLMSDGAQISPAAKEVAARILGSTDSKAVRSSSSPVIDVKVAGQRFLIKDSRRRLGDDPRNAIAWAELARGYLNVGMVQKAKSAMHNARVIAPSNRFILRSSARLLVHCGDRDEAHDILRTAETIRDDPWLISAEIASSALAVRKSRFVRLGRQMLASGHYEPFHTGELASAIATLEVHAGNGKAARKLFALGLKDPTENSVAQAEWATTYINDFTIGKHLFRVPYSHEANARYSFNSEAWSDALSESWKWLYDEPFSSQPAVFGSFIAGDMLENYVEGERIARRGLLANKADPGLLNNLAYSLAHQGKLAEAKSTAGHIKSSEVRGATMVCVLATTGLIAYRSGDPTEGKALYLQAIEEARHQKLDSLRARASLYLAYEELQSNSLTVEAAVKDAIALCGPRHEAGIPQVVRRLKRALESKGASGSALVPSLQIVANFLDKKPRH